MILWRPSVDNFNHNLIVTASLYGHTSPAMPPEHRCNHNGNKLFVHDVELNSIVLPLYLKPFRPMEGPTPPTSWSIRRDFSIRMLLPLKGGQQWYPIPLAYKIIPPFQIRTERFIKSEMILSFFYNHGEIDHAPYKGTPWSIATLAACCSRPVNDNRSCLIHAFLPHHSITSSRTRCSLSSGNLNSNFTVSISIPKMERHVAGPSNSIGAPRLLQICRQVAKLVAHSSEPGLPKVMKSST